MVEAERRASAAEEAQLHMSSGARGVGVSSLGLRVYRVWRLGFRIEGLGFKV